jgi:diguanylate cyclase (GGDEF)-like protein
MNASGPGVTEGTAVDPVSGAMPRALLAAHLAEHDADSGPLAVCLFDLDHFKSVNDAYLHERGDQVLRQVVERVSAVVRPSDRLFRYGGDEFVLLLPGTGSADAEEIAERVVRAIRTRPFDGDPPLWLTVSIGVATRPDDATGVDGLLRVADRRNYLAKRQGRNRAVVRDGDDDDTGLTSFSRLIERDEVLARIHELLDGLDQGYPGVLRLHGVAGAGLTRLIEEAATAARIRGHRVVAVGDLDAAACAASATSPLLVLADTGGLRPDRSALVRVGLLRGGAPVGLVYAVTPGDDDPMTDLPGVVSVAVGPWSAPAVAVWLRTVLRREPAAALVRWISERSGGLPAAALRELRALRDGGQLYEADGRFEVLLPDAVAVRGLPQTPTPLLGRDAEVGVVGELLARSRLVTLVGPGGIGKTRLAMRTATRVAPAYPGGCFFVAFADIDDPALVAVRIAEAVGVTHARPLQLLDRLVETLTGRPCLLVLDNLEQVHGAGSVIGQLVRGTRDVTILVTSRHRLRAYGERVHRVPPLSLPDPSAAGDPRALATTSAAVALFVARARDVEPEFCLAAGNADDVATLCRRLDGLPLAIELAAARADQLTPAQMLHDVSTRLDLLADGSADLPERQRTMRAAIEWSYVRLADAPARAFRALAPFVSPADPPAVAAVAQMGVEDAGAALEHLAEVSLVQRRDGRYTLLEVIREYAVEQIRRSGEEPQLRRRHGDWYLASLPAPQDAPEVVNSPEHSQRLRTDQPNIHAGLQYLVACGEVAAAARGCEALWYVWWTFGPYSEGRALLRTVLAAGAGLGEATVAALRHAAGVLATVQSDFDEARRELEAALAAARRLDDKVLLARVLNSLANVLDLTGDGYRARDVYQESIELRRADGNDRGVAVAVGNLGDALKRAGELAEAERLTRESIAMNRELGMAINEMIALANLGEILAYDGRSAEAKQTLDKVMELATRSGDQDLLAQSLHALGRIALEERHLGTARQLLREALRLRWELGERDCSAQTVDELAALAVAEHRDRDAVRAYAVATALRASLDIPRSAVDQRIHGPRLSALTDRLGRATFQQLWTAGTARPTGEAVAALLNTSSPIG